MKKTLRLLLMTVMAICFSLPCFGAAEAATVALLPLINNVEGGDELANTVFYKNALSVLNSKKGFVVVENDKLNAVIEDAKIGSKVPDAATMAKIAKDGDVDIVIAIQLDKLEDSPLNAGEETKLQLDMKGYTAAYNRITGKAYTHRIWGDKVIAEALTSRWDWTHEEFGRTVRLEVDRALRAK